jgi:hypothetical protein
MVPVDTESFLAVAGGLLSVMSTADRPAELHRALGVVLDVIGPGFTVERFESRGKPSSWRRACPTRSGCSSSPTRRSAAGTGRGISSSRGSAATSSSSASRAGCASSPTPRE